MAKDTIYQYSTTAASNTDCGGVAITGGSAISNFDNAVREIMSHLAEINAGTYPVDDNWTFCDPADRTKKFRFDGVGISTGTTRVITMPDKAGTLAVSADKLGECITTIYTSGSGTFTKNANTLVMEVELVGGGGGGGGVAGSGAGTAQCGQAGGGGGYVRKFYNLTETAALSTASYSVGSAGAGASAGANNGSAGGNTTFGSLTGSGGSGGSGRTGTSGSQFQAGAAGGSASGGDVNIPGDNGDFVRVVSGTLYHSSKGGGSQLGRGGEARVSVGAGNAGTGYGSGGSGGFSSDEAFNRAGGDGAAGIIIVREWRYS